jgi:hypothetical protein
MSPTATARVVVIFMKLSSFVKLPEVDADQMTPRSHRIKIRRIMPPRLTPIYIGLSLSSGRPPSV